MLSLLCSKFNAAYACTKKTYSHDIVLCIALYILYIIHVYILEVGPGPTIYPVDVAMPLRLIPQLIHEKSETLEI